MRGGLTGLGRMSSRPSTDPAGRYNSLQTDKPTENLGATPARGQVLPRQSMRKVEGDFPISSVIGLQEALDGKQNTNVRGQPGGYARLDNTGHVPLEDLPLPLTQSATHDSPDTDSGPTALHHTLGTGANQAARGNHGHIMQIMLPAIYVDGTLIVGSVASKLPIDQEYTVIGTRLTVGTAPTGTDIIVDVKRNGSSIYTPGNRPRIQTGEVEGGPGNAPLHPDLETGDYLTIDVDQIGSGTAGANLTVCVIVTVTF